ncbi:MAG: hypothetical protein A2431_03300 [Candidatus Zambryskibacteria bacterium RIFOXYC1_FULL_39_10]|uniref:Uncharacterized protein n=1 Tax=Candidatus Zambryskibacteria bacterium RIFOXYC1_FULL_39_10 TaxID=1802779 RepID=A0A1G2UYR9_9BACT|nr:MAG: hypothetical protein A2431_03300 [Candidatus Zambryskibacteria bacterium RIFOXYC1_FULL_39_10]OHB15436.1 MAG: hypothetical protein A2605_03510 [Candidatus Zambryskibacteria bacterium RIFOXYD1_FULL_39_35]
MSEEIKNIENNVMDQIQKGKLKMRPKIYFIIGSILTFIGLVVSIVVSVFSIGLIKFVLRSNGILGHKLDRIFSIFPWWMLILAILSLVVGVLLVRKYDFSYKIDFKKVVILAILAILLSGWLVDTFGFNDLLARKGLMRGMMRNAPQERSR